MHASLSLHARVHAGASHVGTGTLQRTFGGGAGPGVVGVVDFVVLEVLTMTNVVGF